MKKLIVLLTAMSLMIGIAKAQVPSYVPTNGLVGWWPFNGNANDESGNGNNGTPMNGVALTTDRNGNGNNGVVNGATLTTDRFGNAGKAYSFDGNADYIDCGNSTSLNFTHSFTISAWVNGIDFTDQRGIVSKSPLPPVGNSYQLVVGPYNLTELNFLDTNLGYSLIPNSWIHLTTILDTNLGTISLFVNGILFVQKTTNITAIGLSSDNLYLGAHRPTFTPNWSWDGSLDDIGIWNRALDSCEIKDLYYASLGNCCSASFSSQPQNQNVNSGSNASFIAQSSSVNATFQWQSNVGMGWQNLSNAGQYSGVTNDTLFVSNLALSNNNQLFRCILSSGTCTDTSATATLSVTETNGIGQLQTEAINIYPNPAASQITILSNASRYPVSYKILNEVGQTILIGELKSNTTSLDISSLAIGNYVLLVGTKHVGFVKNK
jgi:hypothetical protein